MMEAVLGPVWRERWGINNNITADVGQQINGCLIGWLDV